MKKLILICLIFIPTIIYAQKSRVENINLDVKNNDIKISYDLIDIQDTPKKIDLILIDRKKNVYIPENISGNIGTNLQTGKNKLSFNMTDQDFPLDRELTPSIILNRNIKKGPNAALLSVLVPGLGDYFVEDTKNMIIKPYYKTITVGGLLALAFIADGKKQDSKVYEKTVWVDDQRIHYEFVPGHFKTIEITEKAKDYWLFKNDMEIFIGAATSIWLFDIFWVLTKGQQNQKIKSTLKNKNYDFALTGNGFSLQVKLD